MATLDPSKDLLTLAEEQLEADYGREFSVVAKRKQLDKFGFASGVTSTSFVVVSQVSGAAADPTSNSITHVTGGSGDDHVVRVEGHYLTAAGTLVFHVQTVTLSGTTNVPLSQPLARASRAVVFDGGIPTGPINVRIGSGGTSVLTIVAGDVQTQHCKTSTSYRDAWIITNFGGAVLGSNNADVTFELQQRPLFDPSGVAYTDPNWRPMTRRWVLGNEGRAEFPQETPLLVGPNTDVRVVVKTSTGTVSVTAHVDGYLAVDLAHSNETPAAAA